MEADLQDTDFMQGMQDMLGVDEEKVEKIISNLDADTLSDLSDAVANKDEARAKEIIASVETDEQINSLFRGEIAGDEDKPQEPDKRRPHKVSDKYPFKYGDDVIVNVVDPDTHEVTGQEDGTVFKPDGPGNTVGVKIQGKSKMVKRNRIKPLKEDGVMGMVGIPNLARMQELAGIPAAQPQQSYQTPEIEVTDDDDDMDTDTCAAAQQAMQALNVIANVLPNVRLADLKLIRQRILNLQQAMNESVSTERHRKI